MYLHGIKKLLSFDTCMHMLIALFIMHTETYCLLKMQHLFPPLPWQYTYMYI